MYRKKAFQKIVLIITFVFVGILRGNAEYTCKIFAKNIYPDIRENVSEDTVIVDTLLYSVEDTFIVKIQGRGGCPIIQQEYSINSCKYLFFPL